MFADEGACWAARGGLGPKSAPALSANQFLRFTMVSRLGSLPEGWPLRFRSLSETGDSICSYFVCQRIWPGIDFRLFFRLFFGVR